jgi:NDP-sugar pyrophosphorylase family protein
MIIVIPLGGIGKRFSDLGYTDPKPLIKVLGKEIIFWVLDNLNIKKKINYTLYIIIN